MFNHTHITYDRNSSIIIFKTTRERSTHDDHDEAKWQILSNYFHANRDNHVKSKASSPEQKSAERKKSSFRTPSFLKRTKKRSQSSTEKHTA
ncbi:hypothetical protein GJ496_000840 [Pomphorhynchus laevis]|nr:hypothetical protein GJ496_000840 [Pomphorhynchus laevis]